MPTLVLIEPLDVTAEAVDAVVQLTVRTKASEWVGLYDKIEVWRSLGAQTGPYSELTGVAWSGARLPLGAGGVPAVPVTGGSMVLVGQTLVFTVNRRDVVTVTFVGTDPLTAATAASQIQSQSAGLLTAYVDATGQVVVQTASVGTGAVLELTGGTAAGTLGFLLGDRGYGQEPRIQLVSGQELYPFQDLRGSTSAYYRTRFRNALLGTVGEYSQTFGTTRFSALSASSLITGTLDLVDLRGRPLAYREVRVHTNFNGILVEGKLMAGTDLVLKTDTNGHLEVALTRGQQVTVAIVGTDLARDITVPVDPAVTSFNLFDPTLASDDIFKVQVPELVYAERRSL